jgi:hypothetical protein
VHWFFCQNQIDPKSHRIISRCGTYYLYRRFSFREATPTINCRFDFPRIIDRYQPVILAAIPNSEILEGCEICLPSPQPSPKFGRGSKMLRFPLWLPSGSLPAPHLARIGRRGCLEKVLHLGKPQDSPKERLSVTHFPLGDEGKPISTDLEFGIAVILVKIFRQPYRSCYDRLLTVGEVAEWSNASDLKSDEVKASVSSNLTLSVKLYFPLDC